MPEEAVFSVEASEELENCQGRAGQGGDVMTRTSRNGTQWLRALRLSSGDEKRREPTISAVLFSQECS